MKFKETCLVRGSGKGYLSLDIQSDTEIANKFKLKIFKNNNCVYGDVVYHANNNITLVFPLLDESYKLILFYEETEIWTRDLNSSYVKWISRFNYKINNQLSKEIRDVEKDCYLTGLNTNIESIVPVGNEDIIRYSVLRPKDNFSDLTFNFFNSKLESLQIDCYTLGSDELELDNLPGMLISETLYSIRVPNTNFEILIECTSADNQYHSFIYIDKPLRDYFVSRYFDTVKSAHDGAMYSEWLKINKFSDKELLGQRKIRFLKEPLISVIAPLFNTPLELLLEMVNSVTNQTYSNWELVLVNASPDNQALCETLNELCEQNNQIKLITVKENLGISLNSKAGIEASSGEFIAFLDHDDLLAPNALFEYIKEFNLDDSINLFYSDEDKLIDGKRCDPYFKPDFSPFMLRENNYICHFLMIDRNLINNVNFDKKFDGAQDYNTILQCVDEGGKVCHVPKVLYTWRVIPGSTAGGSDAKPYAHEAGKLALQDHLKRNGIDGVVEDALDNCRYHVKYAVTGNPKVSIIIPNKDNADILKQCVESIIEKTHYQNYEILIVENNSTSDEIKHMYKHLSALDNRVQILYWDKPFNYSAINNYAVEIATGEYFVFLNNDTEILVGDWLETMLGICQLDSVGAVGAKLLYPDGLIQHAGVSVQGVTQGDVARHLGINVPRNERGYFCCLQTTRELSAVTAACIMVKKSVFKEVGGFDEKYSVAFNDVDLCMKIRELGNSIIYSPLVELIHYESISRGYERTTEKMLRLNKEASRLRYKWSNQYILGDPYMNNNLDRNSSYFKIGI